MSTPEGLVAELKQIQARVLAEHHRTWLYADEHPEALDSIADHTIVLTSSRPKCHVWALPAGWVQVVNRLHRDLLELGGEYVVTRADQKAGRLCYYITPLPQGAAAERIAAAEEELRHTCELCGVHTAETSTYATRCRRHTSRPGHRILGAMARPPGEAERLGLPVRGEKLKPLMLHRAMAPKLIDDPEHVLAIARHNIERWLPVHDANGMAAHYLREWRQVIDQGIEAVLGVFGGYDERSCDLRQNKPVRWCSHG